LIADIAAAIVNFEEELDVVVQFVTSTEMSLQG
jgi:hypothetical protein